MKKAEKNVKKAEKDVKKTEKKAVKAEKKATKKAEKAQRKTEKRAWSRARPEGAPWVSPILAVSDVRASAAFYAKAFGFELEDVMDGPDGTAVHAMLRHRRGWVMLGTTQTSGIAAPPKVKGTTAKVYVYTADVDALVARAVLAGAKVVSPPADEFWGDRCANLVDPEGHAWMFATRLHGKQRKLAEAAAKAPDVVPPPAPAAKAAAAPAPAPAPLPAHAAAKSTSGAQPSAAAAKKTAVDASSGG